MTAFSARAAYQSSDIGTLSQRDLIVRLYEGAERFLVQACAAMELHEVERAHDGCQRAKEIFSELLSTLNLEVGGEIATRLRDLYVFFIARIVEGNLRKQPAMIREILPIVATLREAWQQVPAEMANVSVSAEASRGHAVDLTT
jgi:flagellar protein FliS